MKKKIAYIISVIALAFTFMMPVAAAPVDVFPGGSCGTGANRNTTVCGNEGSTNPLFGIIKNVINILLYAAGIIAVIMIIIGGISYTLSAGDQSKVTSAKNTILYAIVGLVVAAFSFAIVNFVVVRLF